MDQKCKSLKATEDFIDYYSIPEKHGTKFALFHAVALITDLDNNYLCESKCECKFCDNTAWMNREISIYYLGFNDDAMRQMNLHGIYNTTYQIFTFSEGTLRIIDETNDRMVKISEAY